MSGWLVLVLVFRMAAAQGSGPRSRGFDDPSVRNGSMLLVCLADPTPDPFFPKPNLPGRYTHSTTLMKQKVENTWPSGLGEPLNLIISNASDRRVLQPSMMDGGLYNYFEAFSYGGQCLGLHMGNKQIADLGDGQGNREFHQAGTNHSIAIPPGPA